ncbi:MAG: hypothetical protein RL497_831 [Pseudomonadota bacterium]|jgi:hypothetical protein
MGEVSKEKRRDYRVKLSFYVPADYLEPVKAAVFAAGAGCFGNYQLCAWQTLGQGQFMPLPGARPHTGVVGELTCVPEYRVEMLCFQSQAAAVEAALLGAHPYESPAYEFALLWYPGDELHRFGEG